MNSQILEMLMEIFEVCILPLLGILTAYAVKYIQVKKEEIAVQTDNVLAEKYIKMLADTISDCVIATNQTYVDALKGQNAFDKEAQKEAFRKTSEAVMVILSDDAKNYLSTVYGDLDKYITMQIEANVKFNK